MDKELQKIREKKMNEMIMKSGEGEMKTEIEVNDNDFEKNVIESSNEVPIVVDFWSPMCMPCLVLGPVLEKLAKNYNGKFVLAKINVSQNTATAQAYGITSIPAVKLFKKGKVVDEFVGALLEPQVVEWIEKNLAK